MLEIDFVAVAAFGVARNGFFVIAGGGFSVFFGCFGIISQRHQRKSLRPDFIIHEGVVGDRSMDFGFSGIFCFLVDKGRSLGGSFISFSSVFAEASVLGSKSHIVVMNLFFFVSGAKLSGVGWTVG